MTAQQKCDNESEQSLPPRTTNYSNHLFKTSFRVFIMFGFILKARHLIGHNATDRLFDITATPIVSRS